jgi:hypothetical protein
MTIASMSSSTTNQINLLSPPNKKRDALFGGAFDCDIVSSLSSFLFLFLFTRRIILLNRQSIKAYEFGAEDSPGSVQELIDANDEILMG